MNIYFSYLFSFFICDIYFSSLDGKNNFEICCRVSVKLMSYEVADDFIGHVLWFNDFIGQLNHTHKSWPTLSIA